MNLFHFYIPWKSQETPRFLTFSDWLQNGLNWSENIILSFRLMTRVPPPLKKEEKLNSLL